MELYTIRSSDGVECGPLSLEEIKALVEKGTVKATGMVYTQSSKQWRLAASIPEIRNLIREFDASQDATLDRIRPDGVEGQTTVLKARREARQQPKSKPPLWKKILGIFSESKDGG